MRAFCFAVVGCLIMLIFTFIVVLVTGRNHFLAEHAKIWMILSSFSILISITTIIMVFKLIKSDSDWKVVKPIDEDTNFIKASLTPKKIN